MSDEELRQRIEEQKIIFNAVTREWLDEKFAQFGKWTFYSILAVVFVLILRALLFMNTADLKAAMTTASQIKSLTQ